MEILNLDDIDQFNQLYGLETLHPLVSVVNLNEVIRAPGAMRINYGVYALFLKLEKGCSIKYGRQQYDYDQGTIVCFAPGQTAETTPTRGRVQTNAYGILFHPDLLRATSLNKAMRSYSFFSYDSNEALHLSEDEQSVIMDCLKIIRKELEHDIDRHSKRLIATYIELLLGYCMRFYERQFLTRTRSNRDVLIRFEKMLDDYFDGQTPEQFGLPSVKYFADKLCLSPNYFGDLMKKETGKTPQEFIQRKLIEKAKDRISCSRDTVSQIAYSLGFQYPQHLCRMFKKKVGCTPNEYRTKILG